MLKKVIIPIINVVIITTITFIMIEGMLFIVDPSGLRGNMEWLRFSRENATNVQSYRYDLVPGIYNVHGETVTIDDSGNRLLPDRPDADCTIAFIGDSFTFGWGISDEEMFTYLIAQEYPSVQFINTARPGYDYLSLLSMVENTSADGYLYTIVDNDITYSDPTQVDTANVTNIPYIPMILVYASYWSTVSMRGDADNVNEEGYRELIQVINTAPNRMVAIRDTYAKQVASEEISEQITVVDNYPTISASDPHANAAGHVQIYEAWLPFVDSLIQDVCV